MKHKTQPKPTLHRVIIDTRDASRDKWMTKDVLDKLIADGKIEQISVYANQWTWAFK